MKISWLKNSVFFAILVLLQVWVFNQVHLFGLIIPLPYIYFLLKLSNKANRNVVVLWAFFLGLTIDVFNNTAGINALATTVVGFFRYYVLQLMVSREEEAIVPSTKTMGVSGFIRYALILVLLHHTILFVTEAFSMYSPGLMVLKILGSSVLSLLLILAFELLNFEPTEA